jgi:hypothetical protein
MSFFFNLRFYYVTKKNKCLKSLFNYLIFKNSAKFKNVYSIQQRGYSVINLKEKYSMTPIYRLVDASSFIFSKKLKMKKNVENKENFNNLGLVFSALTITLCHNATNKLGKFYLLI